MDYRELSTLDLERQSAPVVQSDFRVFIAEEAFDRICSNSETTREVGGMLVGEVLRDEGGPFVRVDAIIEALYAEERGAELTLTHATWNHIHVQMDTLHPGKRIVGWYHTHPSFGIFLSDRDRFIQQSFFDLPYQIALVYDPISREHGIFVWRDKHPWRLRQYWIGTHEHHWDQPREATLREAPRTKAAPKSETHELPSAVATPPPALSDFRGGSWVLPAGVIGLLLGFLLGMRFINPANMLEARAQGAKEAINSLNADLLSIIRNTLGDESLWKTFDEGLGQLDRAVKTVRPLQQDNAALQPAVRSLEEAQKSLGRAREDRKLAFDMLRRIEQAAGRSPSESTAAAARQMVEKGLVEQRAALGGIYAELARDAVRSGDKSRAAKLLTEAVNIDPEHKTAYEEQLKSFEPKGSFQPGASGKMEFQPGTEGPQPSPSAKAGEPGTKGNNRS